MVSQGPQDPQMVALYEMMARAEQENPGSFQRMLEAALSGDRMGVEGDTMKMGEGMWNTPSAEGMRIGSTYVASSPLEHLSVAVNRGLGAKFMKDSKAKQQELINQKGAGLEALIKAMSQQPQQPPPQYGAGLGGAAPPLDLEALIRQSRVF